ncbi:MAG: LysM peptidoglycan-binding domain-containing protein [Brevinematales bacterium]|nr:LysM peptidoglycan-binding domain-containing protein [Brevinematales bacterium]
MKKIFSFSIFIFIILLSGACKSKAPPRTNEQIQTVSPSTPTVKQPASATTTPTTSQPSGITDTNIGNRHQSGIILDGAVVYTVKAGDTLSGIARQFYQDGSYYPLIMMVSSGILDIDKIYPNMKFTIPNLKVNMNDPTAKANINRYFLQIAAVEEQRGRSETAALIRNHTR